MTFLKNLLVWLISMVHEKSGSFKEVSVLKRNTEFLVKYAKFIDSNALTGHVHAHVLAEVYGNGRFVPKAYQTLAYSSSDPELILSMYPKVWNFLLIKANCVNLRPDLLTLKKRSFFQLVVSLIGPFVFVISFCAFYFATQHLVSSSLNFTAFNRQVIDGIFLVAMSCFGLVLGFLFTEVIDSKLKALDDLIALAPLIEESTKNHRKNG